MTSQQFKTGDTVRVRESRVLDECLVGQTGTVLRCLPLGRYFDVAFSSGPAAAMLDSELELVTDTQAPVPAPPGIVRTEWGVRTPEWGAYSVRDRAAAEGIARNMREAGHDASVVWRGVTEWQSDNPAEAAL